MYTCAKLFAICLFIVMKNQVCSKLWIFQPFNKLDWNKTVNTTNQACEKKRKIFWKFKTTIQSVNVQLQVSLAFKFNQNWRNLLLLEANCKFYTEEICCLQESFLTTIWSVMGKDKTINLAFFEACFIHT